MGNIGYIAPRYPYYKHFTSDDRDRGAISNCGVKPRKVQSETLLRPGAKIQNFFTQTSLRSKKGLFVKPSSLTFVSYVTR